MGQLSIQKRGISPELKGSELEIIQAREGVIRIKELKKKDLETSLLEIIIRSHHRLRFALPVNNADLNLMAEIFAQDIASYGGTLTLSEVGIACTNGCNSLYGEFMGLSNATFIKWVMTYLQSTQRRDAIIKQQNYLKGDQPELTQDEKDKLSHEAYLECLKKYKETGNHIYLSSGTYDYLQRIGQIKDTKEEKLAAIEKAKSRMIETLQIERVKGAHSFRLKEISTALEKLRVSGDPAINEAKKILLKKHFDGINNPSTKAK